MTARVDKSAAAREVISSSERLMQGLLAQEQLCVSEMDEAVTQLARQTTDRVRARAKARGRAELARSVDDLLPTADTVEPLMLPPLGNLLAMTRQRALEVVARQMRACASTVPTQWRYLASEGVKAAREDAAILERHWYDNAAQGLNDAGVIVRTEMLAQYRLWAAGEEPVDLLLRRWLHPDEVRLAGSATRGVIWSMRARMVGEARNAYIALSSGVMLAGMRGWNAG